MDEIKIFNNPEFGEIRTIIIESEPWFVAMDISERLGYAQTANMLKQVAKEDKTKVPSSDLDDTFSKFSNEVSAINESGLYDAIFGSKLKNAKRFRRWVTSEVLPSIRKTGAYGQAQLPQTVQGQIQLLAQGNVELNQRVDGLEERFNKLEADMPVFTIDAKRIQDAVRKKAVEILGGKESNAYKDKSTRTYVFADVQCMLRRNFEVKRYEEIKHCQTDDALRLIEEHKPPFMLKNRVDMMNAQQSLNLEGGAQ